METSRRLVGLAGSELGSSHELSWGLIGHGKGLGLCFVHSGKPLWGKVKQRKDQLDVCESSLWLLMGGEINVMGSKRNMGLRARGWDQLGQRRRR